MAENIKMSREDAQDHVKTAQLVTACWLDNNMLTWPNNVLTT